MAGETREFRGRSHPRRLSVGVALLVAVAMVTAGPASGADRSRWLDQVNDPTWTGGATHISEHEGDRAAGQTFIPSRSRLVGVEIALLTLNPDAVGRRVTVRVLDPAGAVIATSSQRLESGFEGWLFFNVGDRGVQVVPGATHTLQVIGDGCCLFAWKYAGDTYPEGERLLFGTPRPDTDWLFRTYAK